MIWLISFCSLPLLATIGFILFTAAQKHRLIPVVADSSKLHKEICKICTDFRFRNAIFYIINIKTVKKSVKVRKRTHLQSLDMFT